MSILKEARQVRAMVAAGSSAMFFNGAAMEIGSDRPLKLPDGNRGGRNAPPLRSGRDFKCEGRETGRARLDGSLKPVG